MTSSEMLSVLGNDNFIDIQEISEFLGIKPFSVGPVPFKTERLTKPNVFLFPCPLTILNIWEIKPELFDKDNYWWQREVSSNFSTQENTSSWVLTMKDGTKLLNPREAVFYEICRYLISKKRISSKGIYLKTSGFDTYEGVKTRIYVGINKEGKIFIFTRPDIGWSSNPKKIQKVRK